MIYKFKSQADADVIMLKSTGDQMLTIIGREPSDRGIITVAQIPAALAALEASVMANNAAGPAAAEHAAMEPADGDDSVPLHARAAPFIELLRNSARAGKDVVWGV